jgi:hypothetical protein
MLFLEGSEDLAENLPLINLFFIGFIFVILPRFYLIDIFPCLFDTFTKSDHIFSALSLSKFHKHSSTL